MILDEVINFIYSPKFEEGSHILICGGEIFDRPSDFPALDAFFFNIVQLMVKGRVDLLYVNTNLIYPNLRGVVNLLNQVNCAGLIDRLRFTTSYDIEGRFRTGEDRALMLGNLERIGEMFPTMHSVANTILTKPACEAILNGRFKLKEFMEHNNCWVNLIPYIVLDDNLTAERSLIFKTLKYVDQQCPGYLAKYVPNMAITQEKCLYMYKDNEFQFCSSKIADCGHSVNFRKYCKEGTCFCCDLEEIFNASI